MRGRATGAFVAASLLAGLVAVGLLGGAAGVVEAQVPAYTVTDLGTLGGGTYSFAIDVNTAGQVIGFSWKADHTGELFLWQDGVMTGLGIWPANEIERINDAGQVATSIADGQGGSRALLWEKGRWTDLGTLGGCCSRVGGLNALGQIVGVSNTADGAQHTFLWQKGAMADLGALVLPGYTDGGAIDVNASGVIAGGSSRSSPYETRTFLWQNGTMTALPTLGGSHNIAFKINSAGQMAGFASNAQGDFRAVLWQAKTVQDLGTLGGRQSQAFSVNDSGQVVGHADTAAGRSHAFLVTGGAMLDLNNLVPSSAGWELSSARGINNRGQIVGEGIHNGQQHAFLLTPVSSSTATPAASTNTPAATTSATATASATPPWTATPSPTATTTGAAPSPTPSGAAPSPGSGAAAGSSSGGGSSGSSGGSGGSGAAGGGSGGGGSSSGGTPAVVRTAEVAGAQAAAPGVSPGVSSASTAWHDLGSGRLAITAPGRAQPVVVEVGDLQHTPDQWCARERIYRSHVRLEDTGIAGATFGVVAPGVLDWIPPEDAACVDWAQVDAGVNFPKEVVMQFHLLQPLPGALLWVLDGDDTWRGRLYEVASDGRARYVTLDYWQANQTHFQDVWNNVLPVSWTQIADLQQRGLVGPDE
jgi:probable HAF family extracellular repeat protein